MPNRQCLHTRHKHFNFFPFSFQLVPEEHSIVVRHQSMSDLKVIGCFSIKPPMDCFCDGEALVVAGSHAAMRRMLAIAGVSNPSSYTMKKAIFGEVLAGIRRGGAYAFEALYGGGPWMESGGVRGLASVGHRVVPSFLIHSRMPFGPRLFWSWISAALWRTRGGSFPADRI
jgi:hypothetical protein